MDRKHDVALNTLVLALLLGVAGELLLRAGPWGINAVVAALLLAGGFHALLRRLDLPLGRSAAWLWLVVPVLTAVTAWRASPPLLVLTVLSVLVSLSCAALAAHGRALASAGVWDVLAGGAATAVHTAFGVLPAARDARWSEIGWQPWHSPAGAVVRGAVLAVPPLIVFGALLMSADEAFAQLVADVFRVDVELVLSHVLLAGFFTWLAAGYLHWVVLNDGRIVPRAERLAVRLGALEVGTVLGLVIALFVAFIIVQSTYLFGGEALVQATTGLTYAEYARSGFFELIMAAFLVLPLLLFALWLVRDAAPGGRRGVRVLAGALELLIFLILASALFRMRLYQEAYGMTLDRFYATAFMAWIAVVFVLFAATVLRGATKGFAPGVVAATLAGVLVLAAVNPEARVAEANVERARAGAAFDSDYVRADLGADAVPVLVESLAVLAPAERCATAAWLVEEWGAEDPEADWRTWNHARSRAYGLVRENEPRLRELACPETS